MTFVSEKSVKVLRASAGSGKTYRLTYEYIKRVIVSPSNYSSILAVTFTNKATEEMKSRILSTLNTLSSTSIDVATDYREELIQDTGLSGVIIKKRAEQAKTFILHDYSNFAVSTIDKFFQRIARSFFKELGLDFSYEVELANDNYLERAVVNLIDRGTRDEALHRLISRVVGEELDNNRWNIKSRLVKSGKNLLLNENYKESDKETAELIAIMTRIEKAVKSLSIEVRGKCSDALQLINSEGYSTTDFKWGKTGFAGTLEKAVHNKAELVCSKRLRQVAEDAESELFQQKSKFRDAAGALAIKLQPVLRTIVEMMDQHTVLESSYKAVNSNFSRFLLLSNLSEELDSLWGQNNRLPIHRTTSLIADIVGTTDIPFIYEKLGTRYDCYMIDEFQDTSSGQWQGFKPLLQEAIGNSAKECVMLIGDVKQAIYRWRGGDWNILSSDAAVEFSGRTDDTEQLNTNWRSLPEIVTFNNKLLKHIVDLDTSQLEFLVEGNDELSDKYPRLLQQAYNEFEQQARPNSNGGYIQLDITDEPITKSLETVNQLIADGYRQKDIAILVRQKSHGNLIAKHLINAKYNVISDEALYISSSPIVKFIVSLLKLTVGEENPIAVAEINLRRSEPLHKPLDEQTRTLLQTLSLMPPVAAVEKIIDTFDLKTLETSYLQAFYETVYSYATSKSADLRQFIEWWNDTGHLTTLSLPKDQNAITVITIHKAKGLQFPAVIIPWADWKLIPKSGNTLWTQTNAPLFNELGTTIVEYGKNMANSVYFESYIRETTYSHIDNINLLYVALTRAENSLYIITPPTKEKNDSSISWLINNTITQIAPPLNDSTANIHTFGQHTRFIPKETKADYKSLVFNEFSSWDPSQRLATTLPHHIATSEGVKDSFTGLHLGLVMHDIFSQANTIEDIFTAITAKTISGDLDSDQSQILTQMINKAFKSEQVKDWFSDKWTIMNERTILSPGDDGNTYRPDRVLLSSNKAIIIDYKLGEPRPSHKTQVQHYGELIKQMNINNIAGYLWYVMTGEVIEVEI